MAQEPKKSSSGEAAFGCMVPIVVIIFFALKLCSPSHKEPERVIDYCPDHQHSLMLAQAEVDKINADIAIAEDAVSTKNPTAMRNYRDMVASDLGMLPSQANGWRTVFVGRLSTARNALPSAQRTLGDAQRRYDAVCSHKP